MLNLLSQTTKDKFNSGGNYLDCIDEIFDIHSVVTEEDYIIAFKTADKERVDFGQLAPKKSDDAIETVSQLQKSLRAKVKQTVNDLMNPSEF